MTDVLPVRTGDPDTSYAAAAKAVSRAAPIRSVVLEILRENEPLTHDEIIGRYRYRMVMDPDTPRASDSGIRTRVSELVDQGFVVQDDLKSLSQFGNAAKRWAAVDIDISLIDPVAAAGYAVAAEEIEL